MIYFMSYYDRDIGEPMPKESGTSTWLIILCIVVIIVCICSSVGGSLLYVYDPFGWKEEEDDGVPEVSNTSSTSSASSTNQNAGSNTANATIDESNKMAAISTMSVDPMPEMTADYDMPSSESEEQSSEEQINEIKTRLAAL